MINIYNIQDILENIKIFIKKMIYIFKNWNYSFSENIIEIRNDKENFVFIFLIIINNWIYMKNEKILRNKDIIFKNFFFKYIKQFDFRFARELLKCKFEIMIFECDKWYIKILNDKILTFQFFICFIKYFKKIDIKK